MYYLLVSLLENSVQYFKIQMFPKQKESDSNESKKTTILDRFPYLEMILKVFEIVFFIWLPSKNKIKALLYDLIIVLVC